MQTTELLTAVLSDLGDFKAINVTPLDVRYISTVTDFMVVATGNSSKHVRAIAENLIYQMKERHILPLGIEGDSHDEWVLVDLGDVVVHIMQQRAREFYNLEKLWTPVPCNIASA